MRLENPKRDQTGDAEQSLPLQDRRCVLEARQCITQRTSCGKRNARG